MLARLTFACAALSTGPLFFWGHSFAQRSAVAFNRLLGCIYWYLTYYLIYTSRWKTNNNWLARRQMNVGNTQ